MAIVTYSTAASSSIRPWYGAIESTALTRVVWDNGTYESTFRGIGFTYRSGKLAGGILTDYSQTIAGEDYVSISGLRISGSMLQSYWNTSSYNGFLKAIFAGNDSITGSAFDDYLAGFGSGRDTISGGLGNDTIFGGSANDSILGGDGDDVLYSGGGAMDTILGGDGDDIFYAGGYAVLNGGAGSDTYYLSSGTARITESTTASGLDEVVTQYSYKLANGVEYLTLIGTTHASATGSDGDNRIIGNSGNNTINGGLGEDTLAGGGGRDIFLFDSTPNATTNVDIITDFAAFGTQSDRIAFDKSIFVGFRYFGNVSSSQFLDTATGGEVTTTTRILYDSTTGELSYDRDGAGTVGSSGAVTNLYSPVLIAIVQDSDGAFPTLDFRDFLVVR